MIKSAPPKTNSELLARCKEIEGLSFHDLARALNISVPMDPVRRKGWIGGVIEHILGTTAGTAAKPDFCQLGIELKTIPIGRHCKPVESTFVTSINLLTIHRETWQTSVCYSKLKCVLWIPVEADKSIHFPHRRIGRGFLWSIDSHQEDAGILINDWQTLSFMLGCGKLTEVDARLGQYLQVRPKAANADSLCYGFDECGDMVLTLPRGFYLRSSFTEKIIARFG